ncbi:MAG: hypothetical protein R6W73_07810 [Candidatus Saliniplasma sp.]
MCSKIECILDDKLGYVVPVIYRIQKDKMGLHGREIPSELKGEFIEGMVKLGRSEFEIEIDAPSCENKLRAFIDNDNLDLE